MKTAFVLYPDFTALDLVGPYEVISRWPDAATVLFAQPSFPEGTGIVQTGCRCRTVRGGGS